MDDPAAHLIELKRLCKALQIELAPMSRVNRSSIHDLAQSIVEVGNKIYWWSK